MSGSNQRARSWRSVGWAQGSQTSRQTQHSRKAVHLFSADSASRAKAVNEGVEIVLIPQRSWMLTSTSQWKDHRMAVVEDTTKEAEEQGSGRDIPVQIIYSLSSTLTG